MIVMFEYKGTKPNPRRINKNWVFFSNGKLYEQSIVDYAVKHGVDKELFVEQGSKVIKEKTVAKEEVVKEPVEEVIVKKKTKKKLGK